LLKISVRGKSLHIDAPGVCHLEAFQWRLATSNCVFAECYSVASAQRTEAFFTSQLS
jgi:hypothetical protein